MSHYADGSFAGDREAQDYQALPSPEPSPNDQANISPGAGPPEAFEHRALPRTADGLHKHSCTVCSVRKIKCDRKDPCGNCTKGKSQCIYRAPAPPRRRKKGAAQNDVLERLKRAEDLLAVRSETSDSSTMNNLMWRVADLNLEKRGQLINTTDSSRYLDNSMWIWLNEELRDIRAVLEEDPEGQAALTYGNVPSITEDENFASTVFGGSPRSVSLVDQHPSPVHIMQFWQLYLQNIHPIIKVLHAPTAQQQFIDAASHLDNISRPSEALMFCMYYIVAVAMEEGDCLKRFQEPRETLVPRYRNAAQAALLRADYLTSYNFQVLQAYMLYLIGARSGTQPAAMWALTGIAVRMGHRMGLHRDGEALGLPIFDVEMRRRLWWEIIFFDSRMAQLSGTGGIAISRGVEYKAPRNVNDSELYPGMTSPPGEHDGITEMVHQMMRAEIGYFLISFPRTGTFDGSWQGVAHSTIPLSEKDKLINDLEARLKEMFLDKLDPLIPMHLLAQCVATSATTTIRFMAHHPRQYVKSKIIDSEEERLLFDCACKILENVLFIFTNDSLKRFSYYTRMHFQYLALIYLLRMLRQHTTDAEAERGWKILQGVCNLNPPLLPEAPRTLQLAVADLSLSAWEARQAANPMLPEPNFIQTMRALRGFRSDTPMTTALDTGKNPGHPHGDLVPPPNPLLQVRGPSAGMQAPRPAAAASAASVMAQFSFTGLDWDGWDDLVDGGGMDAFDMTWQPDNFESNPSTAVPPQFGGYYDQGPQV